MATQITTRKGDFGKTEFSGVCVRKHEIPIKLMSTIDQLNSFMGTARAQTDSHLVYGVLETLQLDMFVLSAELATPKKHKHTLKERIDQQFVDDFEHEYTYLSNLDDYANDFIVPGSASSCSGGMIDICRTLARKAESEYSELRETRYSYCFHDDSSGMLQETSITWLQQMWPDYKADFEGYNESWKRKDDLIRQYLNRLSDYLWVVARIEEKCPMLRPKLEDGEKRKRYCKMLMEDKDRKEI